MKAALVYDGGEKVGIPLPMGIPCDDQVCGTVLENLGELAGRVCYDSLGLNPDGKRTGRSTAKYHAHILEVNNTSVYEHCNFTIRLHVPPNNAALACVNRRGVWVNADPSDLGSSEITVNLRAALEWDRYTARINQLGAAWPQVRDAVVHAAHMLAPRVVKERVVSGACYSFVDREQLNENQAWISLYLSGSRGFTHEQVRHRYAISQRSTRYVDEDQSEYIIHPLIYKYLGDHDGTWEAVHERTGIVRAFDASIAADREAYRVAVRSLEAYCTDTLKLDRLTARKQARGAARGFLGNALSSAMIFSAPVSGWKSILRQRLHPAADAEIRAVYTEALPILKSCRYGSMFEKFSMVPSPDGLGMVLDETA
jgi:thymidylate synthase ThyX